MGVTHLAQRGWTDFETARNVIEGELGDGPYLFGDWFTAADVMIGSMFIWRRMFGGPPDLIIKSPDWTVPPVAQDAWWRPTVPTGSFQVSAGKSTVRGAYNQCLPETVMLPLFGLWANVVSPTCWPTCR